jgi:uncharacterized protein (TIGR00106 family)
MPIMEISVVPLGTQSPSVSKYVASCIDMLKDESSIEYVLTSMGTIIQSKSLKKLLCIAEKMHKKVLYKGAKRVVTTIMIDDRIDKKLTMKSKILSVKKKLKQ